MSTDKGAFGRILSAEPEPIRPLGIIEGNLPSFEGKSEDEMKTHLREMGVYLWRLHEWIRRLIARFATEAFGDFSDGKVKVTHLDEVANYLAFTLDVGENLNSLVTNQALAGEPRDEIFTISHGAPEEEASTFEITVSAGLAITNGSIEFDGTGHMRFGDVTAVVAIDLTTIGTYDEAKVQLLGHLNGSADLVLFNVTTC